MNRRTFLQALATTFAAATTAPLIRTAAVLDPPPVIDWTAWNLVEVHSGPTGVLAYVNDVDVTRFPSIMRMITRVIRIDTARGCVAFSAFDAEKGSGLRVTVPQLDGTQPILVGCAVKLSDAPTEAYGSVRQMQIDGRDDYRYTDFDDVYIADTTIEALVAPAGATWNGDDEGDE